MNLGVSVQRSTDRHILCRVEYLVAGISGGVVSAPSFHPLDLIQIRFVVNDARAVAAPGYRGFAGQEILRSFCDLSSIWGSGISCVTYIFIYNNGNILITSRGLALINYLDGVISEFVHIYRGINHTNFCEESFVHSSG